MFALAACARSSHPSSILLVTLDTTRADRIGCYGRAEAGTEALDQLAARGVRFERAYTTAPITLPAHASLLSGSFPPHHGLVDNGLAALDERVETLAEACRASGLRTAAFVSAFPVARPFGLAQGFDVYDDEFATKATPDGIRERRGDETVARARAWLEGLKSDESFFLWVHLFDAHDPYAAPPEYTRRFSDAYQAEVAFADACLGELLDALERADRAPDTVVCVTADHGEGLGEHGEETHALLLYDTTVHVPLVLAGPGIEPRVVSEPVSHADVAATLIEAAHVESEFDFTRLGGRSLVPLLGGGSLPPREAYFETWFPRLHYGWSDLRGLATTQWKYVEAVRDAEPGQHGRAELFARPGDTGETRDLSGEEAEAVDALHLALASQYSRLALHSVQGRKTALKSEELDALAALGYAGADIGALEAGGRLCDPRPLVEAVTLLNRVRALARGGELAGANDALAALAALEPGEVLVHEARGEVHLARARGGEREAFAAAADEFAAACALEPDRRGLWLRRYEALRALGRLSEALESLDRALALGPPTSEFRAARDELERAVRGQSQKR